MPLRDPDKQTVVMTKDLQDQPQTDVLLTHEGEGLMVDEFEVTDLAVYGYRNILTAEGFRRVLVTAFPSRDNWQAYRIEHMDLVPREALNNRQLEAARYNATVLKKLDGIQKETKGRDGGNGMGLYA